MLVACVILVLGVTSCNSDDFESIAPDEQKELSNAELIEQALSRIPKTRADAPFPVVMVTTKKDVSISCEVTESMTLNWGDGSTTPMIKNNIEHYSHTYSDDLPSHGIFLQGSNQAIENLDVYNDGLIYLDVKDNTGLEYFYCEENNLDTIDLTGCPNLIAFLASGNNLSSIDVTHLPYLKTLYVDNNQLTNIDVSENPNLQSLRVGENQIITLDLIKNTALKDISLSGLSVNTINNLPINSMSFATYPQLEQLNIANTPFTSLDLSCNSSVWEINISNTAITQLDISNLQIEHLDAKNSQLTNLIYTSNSLLYAQKLQIEGTSFEKLQSNLFPFAIALPDRNMPDDHGYISQGVLYTNSLAIISPLLSLLKAKNWAVNP